MEEEKDGKGGTIKEKGCNSQRGQETGRSVREETGNIQGTQDGGTDKVHSHE